MRVLDGSYIVGCLSCSFVDKELCDFFQSKKRNAAPITKKHAVESLGKQPDGTWVFSNKVHLDCEGEVLSDGSSCYMWIGDMYSGPGIASNAKQCSVQLPLTTSPLAELMQVLEGVMKHNFFPTVLTIAAGMYALHYHSMLKHLKSCPVPLIFSASSGTGKTTALQSMLSLLGASQICFYSKATSAMLFQLCCHGNLPFALDDPQSRADISRFIVDLYNGAVGATVSRGEMTPKSTAVIAANFTPNEQQR